MGHFEVTISGPKEGNPFCDQWIKGTFAVKMRKKTVDGFYDGDGAYKVRFMPSFIDEYTLKVRLPLILTQGKKCRMKKRTNDKFGIADGGKEAEKMCCQKYTDW